MYAVDLQVQLWLTALEKAEERKKVDDKLLDFSLLLNAVMLDSFTLVLPQIFTTPNATQAKETLKEQLTKKQMRERERIRMIGRMIKN
jgi:hypothetical protein